MILGQATEKEKKWIVRVEVHGVEGVVAENLAQLLIGMANLVMAFLLGIESYGYKFQSTAVLMVISLAVRLAELSELCDKEK